MTTRAKPAPLGISFKQSVAILDRCYTSTDKAAIAADLELLKTCPNSFDNTIRNVRGMVEKRLAQLEREVR